METNTFVKQLASNNRNVRENALETLHKYLNTKQFKVAKQLQYNKLWKGLYYAMWFSDRPRPQQRLANELGELNVFYFNERDNQDAKGTLTLNDEAFIKFSKAFWKIICMEWFQIDRYRIDKFLMLVRRVVFNQLKYLKLRNWDEQVVEVYIDKVLKWLPLSASPKVYNGVPLHIIDVLLDEWERLVRPEDEEEDLDLAQLVQETPLAQFLKIFQDIVANTDNSKVLREAIKRELLADPRLVSWGFSTAKSTTQEIRNEPQDSDDDEDAEEWHGF